MKIKNLKIQKSGGDLIARQNRSLHLVVSTSEEMEVCEIVKNAKNRIRTNWAF